MSGKTDVQFFYVVVTTNENPGSNQSLASVRVLFDGGADRLPPCRMRANTFCALQHDFVRMQTRFTSLQQLIRGQYDRYIVAATHLVGRTGFYIIATRHNSYVTCGYVA